MSISRYRYFEAVARLGSIREASEALHVASSAVSRQIAQLEYDFDVELFERYARGMALTAAGEIMLRHARGLLDHFEGAKAEIFDLQGLRGGHVRVWTIEGLIKDFVVPVVSEFQERYPGVVIEVEAASTDRIINGLAEDEADVGILIDPVGQKGLDVAYEFIDPLHIVAHPDHPVAAGRSIELSALPKLRLALPNKSFGIRRLLDQALETAKVDVTAIFVSGSVEALRSYARSGSGVSLLTRLSVQQELAARQLAAVPLRLPNGPKPMVRICTRRGRSIAVASRELLTNLGEGLLARVRALK
jgi:DNA-binding transcriptional LysR family regulator